MSQTSSCPTCGHANAVGATFCISCSLVLEPLDAIHALSSGIPAAATHDPKPFIGSGTSESQEFDVLEISSHNADSTDSFESAILTTPTVFLADDPLSFSAEFAAFEIDDVPAGEHTDSESGASGALVLSDATNGDPVLPTDSELAEASSDASELGGDSLAARLRKHLQRSRASSQGQPLSTDAHLAQVEPGDSSIGAPLPAENTNSSTLVEALDVPLQTQEELPEEARPTMASLDLRGLLVPTVALEPIRLDDVTTASRDTAVSEESESDGAEEKSPPSRPDFLTARPRRAPVYPPLPRAQTHTVPATLTLFQHRRAVERYPLTEAINIIGRKGAGVGNTLLDLGELDPSASPAFQHATIFQTNRNFTLHVTCDAGTQVNREVLALGTLRNLQHGDVLVFGGKHPLHFEIHED